MRELQERKGRKLISSPKISTTFYIFVMEASKEETLVAKRASREDGPVAAKRRRIGIGNHDGVIRKGSVITVNNTPSFPLFMLSSASAVVVPYPLSWWKVIHLLYLSLKLLSTGPRNIMLRFI